MQCAGRSWDEPHGRHHGCPKDELAIFDASIAWLTTPPTELKPKRHRPLTSPWMQPQRRTINALLRRDVLTSWCPRFTNDNVMRPNQDRSQRCT
jgi:hypothetical protein